MAMLWKQRVQATGHCDVTVGLGSRTFQAHRCVLSAWSPEIDQQLERRSRQQLRHTDQTVWTPVRDPLALINSGAMEYLLAIMYGQRTSQQTSPQDAVGTCILAAALGLALVDQEVGAVLDEHLMSLLQASVAPRGDRTPLPPLSSLSSSSRAQEDPRVGFVAQWNMWRAWLAAKHHNHPVALRTVSRVLSCCEHSDSRDVLSWMGKHFAALALPHVQAIVASDTLPVSEHSLESLLHQWRKHNHSHVHFPRLLDALRSFPPQPTDVPCWAADEFALDPKHRPRGAGWLSARFLACAEARDFSAVPGLNALLVGPGRAPGPLQARSVFTWETLNQMCDHSILPGSVSVSEDGESVVCIQRTCTSSLQLSYMRTSRLSSTLKSLPSWRLLYTFPHDHVDGSDVLGRTCIVQATGQQSTISHHWSVLALCQQNQSASCVECSWRAGSVSTERGQDAAIGRLVSTEQRSAVSSSSDTRIVGSGQTWAICDLGSTVVELWPLGMDSELRDHLVAPSAIVDLAVSTVAADKGESSKATPGKATWLVTLTQSGMLVVWNLNTKLPFSSVRVAVPGVASCLAATHDQQDGNNISNHIIVCCGAKDGEVVTVRVNTSTAMVIGRFIVAGAQGVAKLTSWRNLLVALDVAGVASVYA